MCSTLSLICLTHDTETAARFWGSQHTANRLRIDSQDNWKDKLTKLCLFPLSVLQTCLVCMQLVGWGLIDQHHTLCKKKKKKKPKEPKLPASHHLAQTHHVNFMTTACYRCQFFPLNRIHWDTHKSLGHSSFIMLFLSIFDGLNERFKEMLNPMGLVR